MTLVKVTVELIRNSTTGGLSELAALNASPMHCNVQLA